jgi:hypothetical protein
MKTGRPTGLHLPDGTNSAGGLAVSPYPGGIAEPHERWSG